MKKPMQRLQDMRKENEETNHELMMKDSFFIKVDLELGTYVHLDTYYLM